MQIGICDDNKRDIDVMAKEVESVLVPLACKYEIHLFESGIELMRHMDEVLTYDVLFLDIDMPEISGIQIAEKIMNSTQVLNIIFVTNHSDLVFDAIHCCPFRFIRKERMHEEMEEAIVAVLEKIRNETLLYDFNSAHGSLKVLIRDVLYLESRRHYIHIHTKDGQIHVIRGKISYYDEKLSDAGFVRIHVGYLVNIMYIYSISTRSVVLDNKEELPISRKNADKVKEKHADYVRRFIRGIH